MEDIVAMPLSNLNMRTNGSGASGGASPHSTAVAVQGRMYKDSTLQGLLLLT
eukprot:CAMPEP_0172917098 /NCGR_PEP_ID=MMETSP1075-20121228/197634_1 /TAXON_ID=2916 /ORGANISM="Ceratium fusus, Strain PA161109" /LENGTH=51 /DNA_ID=CAMNT_0013776515 /DNA_START=53 /DNA_END=208 /DNA_ORIENTATION=+